MTRAKRTKTIAQHMRDVLTEYGCGGVMWGDVCLLDEAAERCTHTGLMDMHPMTRHPIMLTACQKSGLFETWYVNVGSHSKQVRSLRLKGAPIDSNRSGDTPAERRAVGIGPMGSDHS